MRGELVYFEHDGTESVHDFLRVELAGRPTMYTEEAIKTQQNQGVRRIMLIKNFVEYGDAKGRFQTLTWEYRPFSSKATELNQTYPSIYGPVDGDWFCCIAFEVFLTPWFTLKDAYEWYPNAKAVDEFGKGFLRSVASFFGGHSNDKSWRQEYDKSLWSTGRKDAPYAAYMWARSEITLAEVFAPALKLRSLDEYMPAILTA